MSAASIGKMNLTPELGHGWLDHRDMSREASRLFAPRVSCEARWSEVCMVPTRRRRAGHEKPSAPCGGFQSPDGIVLTIHGMPNLSTSAP